jgi:hypothetical protein
LLLPEHAPIAAKAARETNPNTNPLRRIVKPSHMKESVCLVATEALRNH